MQIASDLHLEFMDGKFPKVKPAGKMLALLGDIGDPGKPGYARFLADMAGAFERVFVLAGNHEFYGRSIDEGRALIAQACAQSDRLTFLDDGAADIPGTDVTVLGTTLWSDILPSQEADVRTFIADLRLIRGWSVPEYRRAHAASVKWLEGQIAVVAARGRRAVVLSHHAPLLHELQPPRHAGSPISSAFGTDLGRLMVPPVAAWAHGHTHHSHSGWYAPGAGYSKDPPPANSGGYVRLVSNQKGYPGEGVAYDQDFVLPLSLPSAAKEEEGARA